MERNENKIVHPVNTVNKVRKGRQVKMKKKKPIVLEELSAEELVKYEIAKELGLFDRVMKDGWGSLSAKETGAYWREEESRKKR